MAGESSRRDRWNEREKAKYHLQQINEDDSERAYELAQERMDNVMQDIDILLLKARNCEECNNYDQSLILLDSIESKYTNVTDEYIVISKKSHCNTIKTSLSQLLQNVKDNDTFDSWLGDSMANWKALDWYIQNQD